MPCPAPLTLALIIAFLETDMKKAAIAGRLFRSHVLNLRAGLRCRLRAERRRTAFAGRRHRRTAAGVLGLRRRLLALVDLLAAQQRIDLIAVQGLMLKKALSNNLELIVMAREDVAGGGFTVL